MPSSRLISAAPLIVGVVMAALLVSCHRIDTVALPEIADGQMVIAQGPGASGIHVFEKGTEPFLAEGLEFQAGVELFAYPCSPAFYGLTPGLKENPAGRLIQPSESWKSDDNFAFVETPGLDPPLVGPVQLEFVPLGSGLDLPAQVLPSTNSAQSTACGMGVVVGAGEDEGVAYVQRAPGVVERQTVPVNTVAAVISECWGELYLVRVQEDLNEDESAQIVQVSNGGDETTILTLDEFSLRVEHGFGVTCGDDPSIYIVGVNFNTSRWGPDSRGTRGLMRLRAGDAPISESLVLFDLLGAYSTALIAAAPTGAIFVWLENQLGRKNLYRALPTDFARPGEPVPDLSPDVSVEKFLLLGEGFATLGSSGWHLVEFGEEQSETPCTQASEIEDLARLGEDMLVLTANGQVAVGPTFEAATCRPTTAVMVGGSDRLLMYGNSVLVGVASAEGAVEVTGRLRWGPG